MDEKIVLITGSTDGIGMYTALALAEMGMRVLLHGRDPARAKLVRDKIRDATGNDHVDFLIADFAELEQVHALADAVRDRYGRLDVLVNNAGVYLKQRRVTADGIEATFQINHLAPFLLTHLLLDRLEASAPSRIVTVSSTTHQSARIDFDNLQGEKWYDGFNAYSVSKFGNIVFTCELASRLHGTRVTANALHPGAVNTKLLRAGFGSYGLRPEQGAETPVYLASSPEVESVTGKYFVNKRAMSSSPLTYDPTVQKEFWRISQELTEKAMRSA